MWERSTAAAKAAAFRDVCATGIRASDSGPAPLLPGEPPVGVEQREHRAQCSPGRRLHATLPANWSNPQADPSFEGLHRRPDVAYRRITVLYAHLGRGAGVTPDAGYSVRVEILARSEYSNPGTTIAIAEDAVENGRSEPGDKVDTKTVSRERTVLVAAGQSSSSLRSSATSP